MATSGVANAQLDLDLRIELFDDNSLVASLTTPLTPVISGGLQILELERAVGILGDASCTVTVQAVDDEIQILRKHVVYLVRHGESLWNEAQSTGNISELLRTTDHPLSKHGRLQAERLCRRLRAGKKEHELPGQEGTVGSRDADHAASILSAPNVAMHVSPLTRAMQTAIIALGPLQRSAYSLTPNAREQQNLGGFDTMSSKLGQDLVRNACGETRRLYEGEERAQSDAVAMAMGELMTWDTDEVEEAWWCAGPIETADELRDRTAAFFAQMGSSPYASNVVVGHSHFFRHILRECLATEFAQEHASFAADLRQKKLNNCGVLRIELDNQAGSRPIVGAELCFGSYMEEGSNARFANCCAQPRTAAGIGEFLVEQPGGAFPDAPEWQQPAEPTISA